jgi:hypothetical protein
MVEVNDGVGGPLYSMCRELRVGWVGDSAGLLSLAFRPLLKWVFLLNDTEPITIESQ